jgi:hypothetical protein
MRRETIANSVKDVETCNTEMAHESNSVQTTGKGKCGETWKEVVGSVIGEAQNRPYRHKACQQAAEEDVRTDSGWN